MTVFLLNFQHLVSTFNIILHSIQQYLQTSFVYLFMIGKLFGVQTVILACVWLIQIFKHQLFAKFQLFTFVTDCNV